MMYRIGFFFLLINFSWLLSQEHIPKKDKIEWMSTRKLSWKDFQGMPKTNRGNIVAETHGRIMLEFIEWRQNVPKWSVKCFFLKKKSWMIVDDSETLLHEQLHFDLYEFYTRNIRRAFQILNQQGVTDLEKYKEVFQYYTKENDQMNQQYDQEVYGNTEKQKEWHKRIMRALNKTQHFALQ